MADQSEPSSETEAARSLLSAVAVRERSHGLLEHGLAGRLNHFAVDLDRLDGAADEVVKTISANYPDLDIPFHARWRHFSAGGLDRWASVVPMVFQVRSDNPLVGLEGRAALLNRLGQVVAQNDDVFGREDSPRPGGLFDLLAGEDEAAIVPAPAILEAVLLHLGAIWPGRIALGGIDLGDTWRHPLAEAPDASKGLVPFHKLSQWLSSSLIEPLKWTGLAVSEVGGLTGLPEYRNGGLFLNTGVVTLKDPAEAEVARRSCVRSSACLRTRCPSPRCWKAAPGPRAAASRAKSAPTVRRR
jgi:hypothetical protein